VNNYIWNWVVGCCHDYLSGARYNYYNRFTALCLGLPGWACTRRNKVLICIWLSWCHCHSLSFASIKSRLVLPKFWYWLNRVVPDKGPLNGCCCYIHKFGIIFMQLKECFRYSRTLDRWWSRLILTYLCKLFNNCYVYYNVNVHGHCRGCEDLSDMWPWNCW